MTHAKSRLLELRLLMDYVIKHRVELRGEKGEDEGDKGGSPIPAKL